MRVSKRGDLLVPKGGSEYLIFRGIKPPNPNTPAWDEFANHEWNESCSALLVIEVPTPMPEGDFVRVLTQNGLGWVYESDFYVM